MRKVIVVICVFLAMCFVGCAAEAPKNDPQCTHSFSVSETKQVYFAPGNLQYCPADAAWRFAENSYDIIGENNAMADEGYEGWLDLFCWGANGLSGVEPYSTLYDNFFYGNGHNSIAGTKWDFSKAINKQDGSDWRMFTHDEIHYLLMYRENAEDLFGYGTIGDVKGLFILPDDWTCPEGIEFISSVQAGFENQYNWYYTIGDNENYLYNRYSTEEWEAINEAGGVFLPAAGKRSETICEHIGISGHYWTSSNYGEEFANCLCLFEHDLFLEGNFDRSYALSVRLVRDAT